MPIKLVKTKSLAESSVGRDMQAMRAFKYCCGKWGPVGTLGGKRHHIEHLKMFIIYNPRIPHLHMCTSR